MRRQFPNRQLATTGVQRLMRTICAALALGASAAHASDSAAPTEHGAAEPSGEARTDILDLGAFRLRTTGANDGEVVDLRFTLYVVLSTDADEHEYERLVHWRRRLRDQAIIAIRSAEPADFADPDLRRLHRLILFRVKRLPIASDVIGVYLSDFSIEEGEDISAQYEPMIIPPAEPTKKPADGGH